MIEFLLTETLTVWISLCAWLGLFSFFLVKLDKPEDLENGVDCPTVDRVGIRAIEKLGRG